MTFRTREEAKRPVSAVADNVEFQHVVEVVVRLQVVAVVAFEHRADETRRAVTALHGASVDEGLLHRMELIAVGQAFDRGDLGGTHSRDRH